MEPAKPNQAPPAGRVPSGSSSVLPRHRLMDLVNLRMLSQAVCVATKKGIANIVTGHAPVHISEAAKKLNCNEINLYRLMNYLSGFGVFEEKEGQFFIGNDLSEAMRENVEENCYHMIMAFGTNPQWQATVNMELALEKDNEKTPFELINGAPLYEYLCRHPDDQRHFDLGVKSQTQGWQSKVPSFYDFSRYQSIVDMAGGCGVLLKSIMTAHPNVQGVLFENPEVIKNALPELLADDQFKTRFRAVSGNFLEKVDVAADLYIVAMTLHCFEDTRLSIILKNIANSMRLKPGSRLLIIELDYEKSFKLNDPGQGRDLDMAMMLIMGGRERNFGTWQSLLNAQGLKVLQKVQFPPNFMGLECELA